MLNERLVMRMRMRVRMWMRVRVGVLMLMWMGIDGSLSGDIRMSLLLTLSFSGASVLLITRGVGGRRRRNVI